MSNASVTKIGRILYMGYENEYGLKENGESINNRGFYQNFKKLGYEIVPVWYDHHVHDELQCKILDEYGRLKPDIVFCILQKDQVDKRTLLKLKERGAFLVNWFGDDQWRFDNYSQFYAKYFDVCITTDKYSVEKYIDIGQKNIIRSQWASLDAKDESVAEYEYDVSFVGGMNTYRKWYVQHLEKQGLHVECFGDGWPNGRVSWDEMERIFRVSRINLNISNSVSFDMRYLLSSPKNIAHALLGKKNKSQTKARIFEIPVFGGFEITEYVPSLEDYFDIGKEICCYKDVDEAVLQIQYYLNHSEIRELIKKHGIERARREHTFKHRIISFMASIEELMQKG